MKPGGHKDKVRFIDRTIHGIPHEEQDELLKRAPYGTSKILVYEDTSSYGRNLRLEVVKPGAKLFVCSVAGRSCVDALDKLRACLERLTKPKQ